MAVSKETIVNGRLLQKKRLVVKKKGAAKKGIKKADPQGRALQTGTAKKAPAKKASKAVKKAVKKVMIHGLRKGPPIDKGPRDKDPKAKEPKKKAPKGLPSKRQLDELDVKHPLVHYEEEEEAVAVFNKPMITKVRDESSFNRIGLLPVTPRRDHHDNPVDTNELVTAIKAPTAPAAATATTTNSTRIGSMPMAAASLVFVVSGLMVLVLVKKKLSYRSFAFTAASSRARNIFWPTRTSRAVRRKGINSKAVTKQLYCIESILKLCRVCILLSSSSRQRYTLFLLHET